MRVSGYGRAETATTVEEKERKRATSTMEPELENSILARHKEAVEHVLATALSPDSWLFPGKRVRVRS